MSFHSYTRVMQSHQSVSATIKGARTLLSSNFLCLSGIIFWLLSNFLGLSGKFFLLIWQFSLSFFLSGNFLSFCLYGNFCLSVFSFGIFCLSDFFSWFMVIFHLFSTNLFWARAIAVENKDNCFDFLILHYMNVSDQKAIFTYETKMLISIFWKYFLAFNVLNMTRTE